MKLQTTKPWSTTYPKRHPFLDLDNVIAWT